MDSEEQDAKFKKTSKVLLTVGGIVELITLIPIAGDFLGWTYEIWQTYYLHSQGFGWRNWGRLATSGIVAVAEFIPGVQEFPCILAGVAAILLIIKLEQKTGITLSKKGGSKFNSGGMRQPPGRVPINQSDTRLPNKVSTLRQEPSVDGLRSKERMPLRQQPIIGGIGPKNK